MLIIYKKKGNFQIKKNMLYKCATHNNYFNKITLKLVLLDYYLVRFKYGSKL